MIYLQNSEGLRVLLSGGCAILRVTVCHVKVCYKEVYKSTSQQQEGDIK